MEKRLYNGKTKELASARKLAATEEFDILGGTERDLAARRQQEKEDEARGAVGFLGSTLMSMVGPTKDSVGIRLLRRLGWKPGQGIGPRVSGRQRKMELAAQGEQVEDDEWPGDDVTFAPRDTPIVDYTPKNNTFGLGYDLEKFVPQVAEMRRLRELNAVEKKDEQQRRRRAAFGVHEGASSREAGFGLGAFEDDEDDIDVYGEVGMKDYHHTLYEEEEEQQQYQEPPSKRVKTAAAATEEEDTSSLYKTRCSDGRLPLRGFSVSKAPQALGKWYRPPQVPPDFDERHVPATTTADNVASEPRRDLTSEERGAILGEKPTEPRSVFDYVPAKSKDRLDNLLRFVTDKRPKDPTKLADFPTITKQQAQMALRGFMPFGDNLKKQKRYRQYLENQAGLLSEDGEPEDTLPVPEGLTYEEAMKELDEFAKAARIFRPISAMMSGRFTSASGANSTVEQVTFEGGLKTEAQWRKEKEIKDKQEASMQPQKETSQEAEAAAMKMFGQLTRTVKPFYPTKLVCKRFNVRNPHPNHDASASGRTQAGTREALSEETMEDMLRSREKPRIVDQWKDDPALSAIIPKPSERAKEPKAETTEEEKPSSSTAEEEETSLNYERPSMDIFKAIFENSEDEEEEEKTQVRTEPANAESQGMAMTQPAKAAPTRQEDVTMGPTRDVGPQKEDDAFVGPPPPPPDRPEIQETKLNVVSEQVVVEPFRSRFSRAKRRRVSVSEEESTDEDEEKAKSRRRKHSRKRSRSRDKKKKKKKEKKEKKSSKRHSRHTDDDDEEEEKAILEQAVWVEKEQPEPSRKPRARASDLW